MALGNPFQLLPQRADSEYIWTVDLTARRDKAAAEVAPVRKQAQAREREAAALQQQLLEMKKAWKSGTARYREKEAELAAARKEARELEARAQAIEDAVYDIRP